MSAATPAARPVGAALELPAVLTALAGHCGFPGSEKLARRLQPATSAEQVRRRQDETAEAIAALAMVPGLSCSGSDEIAGILQRARIGAVLDKSELGQLRNLIAAFHRFGRSLAECLEAPDLARRARRIDPLPGLAQAIDRTVDQHGRVRDQASPELARLRGQLRRHRAAIESQFGRMVSRLGKGGLLSESVFTVRGGRYVLPLRRESQRHVPGVVHDLSSSGATAYVEPLEMVSSNNRLRTLQSGVRSEERRVLASLSEKVRASADALERNWEQSSDLDLVLARGKLSLEQGAVRPVIVAENRFDLRAARHPLLGSAAVPIDVFLGDSRGFRALVITGSNAGGKTVALKTVGLLHLMAACGLQIPAAAGSEVTVFDQIFADIGDQQSIVQNLSTFSSHMRNLARALERAGPRSLVLADEIGAGTDPAEGRGAGGGDHRRTDRARQRRRRDHPFRGPEALRHRAPAGAGCQRRVRPADAAAQIPPAHRGGRVLARVGDSPTQRNPGIGLRPRPRRSFFRTPAVGKFAGGRAPASRGIDPGTRRSRRRPPRGAI